MRACRTVGVRLASSTSLANPLLTPITRTPNVCQILLKGQFSLSYEFIAPLSRSLEQERRATNTLNSWVRAEKTVVHDVDVPVKARFEIAGDETVIKYSEDRLATFSDLHWNALERIEGICIVRDGDGCAFDAGRPWIAGVQDGVFYHICHAYDTIMALGAIDMPAGGFVV